MLAQQHEPALRMQGMESMLALLYERETKHRAASMVRDAGTQTEQEQEQQQHQEGWEEGVTVSEKPVLAGPVGSIFINLPMQYNGLGDGKTYRREVCASLRHIVNRSHKPLVSSNRAVTLALLVKVIVFINRPDEYINERWSTQRPLFSNITELDDFIAEQKNMVIDFYDFTIVGVIPSAMAPRVRTASDLSGPYQRKNVLKPWQEQIVF